MNKIVILIFQRHMQPKLSVTQIKKNILKKLHFSNADGKIVTPTHSTKIILDLTRHVVNHKALFQISANFEGSYFYC